MSTENVNFVAPQGQINQSFTAPDTGGGSSRVKNENVQLMPSGPNPGIIYAIVDLGTQTVQYGNSEPEMKRQLYVGIEFPQLKQFFYVGDTEARSTVVSDELNMFITAENSNMRHFIHAVEGRNLTNDEARTFNLFSLIGKKVVVDIEHKISKRTNQPYMNVRGYSTLNNNFNIPQDFNLTLDPMAFAIDCDATGNVIGNNFKTENFAKLYNFIKNKVLASKEAKDYAQRGGQFAKMPESSDNQQSSSPTFQNAQQAQTQSAQVPQAVQNNMSQPQATSLPPNAGIPMGYEMKDPNGAPIASYIQSGWSIDQLIQHGVLIKTPQAPQAPAVPQAPQAPQPPQVPQAPADGNLSLDPNDAPF